VLLRARLRRRCSFRHARERFCVDAFVRAAGRAIEQGFGKSPVFVREGGSIPVVATFERELGLPSVLFGVGLPDENAHAPDEKLDLGDFHNGIIASAYLYQEIANT
jgi:acetylornithine deacetylase/succinyl-diaminopimelate desuccinylase-like protein